MSYECIECQAAYPFLDKARGLRRSANMRAHYARRPGKLETTDVAALLVFTDLTCLYCGVKHNPRSHPQNITLDHIVSFDREGENKLYNVLPCCRSCNNKKNTYSLDTFLHLHQIVPSEFYQRWKLLLELIYRYEDAKACGLIPINSVRSILVLNTPALWSQCD